MNPNDLGRKINNILRYLYHVLFLRLKICTGLEELGNLQEEDAE